MGVAGVVGDESTSDGDGARREGRGAVCLVRRKQDRRSVVRGATHYGIEKVTRIGVESGVGFIEEPETWLAYDQCREGRSATLPRGA